MNNSRMINRKGAEGKCLFLACFMMLFSVFGASVGQVHGQATSPPDSAATTSLYGRVALEGRPARSLSDDWFVWICVQFKENLKFLPTRQSNRDLYCYKVQPGPQVRLIFWNTGYDKMATPWFPANDPYALAVPTVELSRHHRHRKVASAAEWVQELDGQLGLAKATRSYDIFAWNLAEAAYAAHDDPALRTALDRYGTSVQSQAGMPADFRNTQALYASIIAQNGGSGASVNEQAVFSLAQAQGAFHDTYAVRR